MSRKKQGDGETPKSYDFIGENKKITIRYTNGFVKGLSVLADYYSSRNKQFIITQAINDFATLIDKGKVRKAIATDG